MRRRSREASAVPVSRDSGSSGVSRRRDARMRSPDAAMASWCSSDDTLIRFFFIEFSLFCSVSIGSRHFDAHGAVLPFRMAVENAPRLLAILQGDVRDIRVRVQPVEGYRRVELGPPRFVIHQCPAGPSVYRLVRDRGDVVLVLELRDEPPDSRWDAPRSLDGLVLRARDARVSPFPRRVRPGSPRPSSFTPPNAGYTTRGLLVPGMSFRFHLGSDEIVRARYESDGEAVLGMKTRVLVEATPLLFSTSWSRSGYAPGALPN